MNMDKFVYQLERSVIDHYERISYMKLFCTKIRYNLTHSPPTSFNTSLLYLIDKFQPSCRMLPLCHVFLKLVYLLPRVRAFTPTF